ncbi:MAG: hypothetical protein WAM60_24365 [Candidatus Promineifilaceae bacterium]
MSKRFALISVLFLLIVSTVSISAAGTADENVPDGSFWSPPETAGDFSLLDFERGADGIIHMIGRKTSCCPYEIYYTQRDLAGNWSSPVPIDDDVELSRFGEGDLVVSNDGTVHAIWVDKEGSADHKAKYAKRTPNGSWSAPITISGANQDAAHVTLLINDSNELYASWFSYGIAGLYSRHQVGGVWGNIERVDDNQAATGSVMLMDSQQNVHYFWYYESVPHPENAGVFYRKQSADDSWGSVIPVSDAPDAPGIATLLFATVDSQNGQDLYVTWGFEEGSDQNIYFAEFTNGTWKDQVKLNTTNSSFYPVFLGGSSNNVYIISGDNSTQTHTFYFRPSGGSWTSEPMGFLGTTPRAFGLVSRENTFHLVWRTTDNQSHYRSRQNLEPWSAIEAISGNIVDGQRIIKQRGINLDMAWQAGSGSIKYSHGLSLFTDLPPQQYIPGMFK